MLFVVIVLCCSVLGSSCIQYILHAHLARRIPPLDLRPSTLLPPPAHDYH